MRYQTGKTPPAVGSDAGPHTQLLGRNQFTPDQESDAALAHFFQWHRRPYKSTPE